MAGSKTCRHALAAGVLLCATLGISWAEDVAQGELLIRGAALQVSPLRQEVDPGRPTVVHTSLGDLAPGEVPAGLRVVGELDGPGFETPLELTAVPGEPFRIPGLVREGTYHLSGIRLEQGGAVLQAAQPDEVEIVVHRLVIASVTSRPLTPEEMAAAGIVITDDSYTVWRYSVGFATESGTFEIPFDLAAGPDGLTVLPDQDPYQLLPPASTPPPSPPQIHMVNIEIPDAEIPDGGSGDLDELPPPSIPGFLIIPGDVAFLHQFFSAILVVQNGALEGSGIELRNLNAVLEPADDGVRQAETEPPTVPGEPVPVTDPGPDGQPGTSDDLTFIVAQSSGQATWYVEGLEEGQHLIRVRLAGEIDGLASGRPAPFETTVPGVVLVRDPRFALTFVHPWTVRAGELYQLEVVISNTSATPVYDLHMSLPGTELSGAQLADPGAADRVIPELPPGESASVSWDLMSLTTGRVVASAFNTSSSMTASFRFHVGVGELGIPLSPDSLVLPPDVYELPGAWTDPAIELLGLAHSMANAPPGAELTLPPVSEGMVIRRGQELAAAARRASLGEAQDRCLLDAGLKWLGTATWDPGWDALRRASRRGHDLEHQLGLVLGRRIGELGLDAALAEVAELALSGRPLVIVAAEGAGYQRSARLRLSGALTQTAAAGQAADTTLFSRDLAGAAVMDVDGPGFQGEIGLISVPVGEDGAWGEGGYQVQLLGLEPGSVGIRALMVMPDGSTRSVRPAPIGTAANSLAFFNIGPELDTVQVFVDQNGDMIQDGGEDVPVETAPAPAPRLLLARFDDTLQPADGGPYRSVLLLFSQMLDSEALAGLDPEEFSVSSHLELPAGGTPLVVDRPRAGEALVQQIDPHVLVAVLSAPLNPHAELSLSSGGQGIPFLGGQELVLDGAPVETGGSLASGAIRGVVAGSDGAPVPGALVELYEQVRVDDPIQGPTWLMARSDSVTADGAGRFVLDAVRARAGQVDDRYGAFLLRAVEPGTSHEARAMARLDGDGSVRDLTLAMVGRGDVVGTLSREDGSPLRQPEIAARSAVDPTQGARGTIQPDGSFLIPGLPVGPVQIAARDGEAMTFATAYVPGPGQQASVDLVLPSGTPPPRASVDGQVVSAADGSGLRGVQVYLVPDGQAGAVAVATTASDGGFTLADVPAGPAWLKAYDPNRSVYVGQVHVDLLADAVTTVQILAQAPATASIQGTVFHMASGSRVPVEGVYVVAAGPGRYAVTDASGAFRLDELPLGSVHLTATDPATGDTASASLDLTAPGQVLTVELDLSSSEGSIQGVVVDRDGAPVYGASVAVGRFGGGLEATTDGSGAFLIQGVAPGTHEVLVASSDGSRFGKGSASVLYNGDVAEVTVVLGGTVDLEVVTVAETTGGGSAEVLSQFEYRKPGITSEGRLGLVPEDGWLTCAEGDPDAACSVDASGHAHFTGLPEGVGRLVVTASNAFYGRLSLAEELDPSDDGRTLTLNYSAPGMLSGRVTIWDGSETVEGATVQLWIKDDHGAFVPQQAVSTGPGGAFAFDLVRPGAFRITAYDPVSGSPGWVEGRIGSAQQVEDLEIRLHRLGSVSGTVELCARGDAPAGKGDEVHLRLTPDNVPQPLLDGLTPPALAVHEDDADLSSGGAFAFTGLASGRWTLWASSALHGTAVVPVTVPEDGGEAVLGEPVCLHPAGSVGGIVRDPQTGEPVANASVQLWVDAVPPYVATADLSAADGSFLFSPVPVGRSYHVAAFDPASNRGGASPHVRLCSSGDAGFGETCVQDADVEVELQPQGMVQGTVTTAEGEPVEGAFVRLRGQVVTGQSGSIVTSGVELWGFTDPSGTFSFDGVPAGTARIAAFAPDSQLWREVEVAVDPVATPVTTAQIGLPAVGTVTVRVLDPDGVPLGSDDPVVAFRQSSIHYLEPSGSSGRVEALLQGAETVFDAVEGDYEIGVCQGACTPATVDDVLFHRFPGVLAAYAHPSMPDPPGDQVVELELVGRAALAVRVVDGTGQPASGAAVTVSGSGFYGGVTLSGQTGADGTVAPFENLGVGRYTVAATLADGSGNVIRGVSQAEIRQEDHGETIAVEVVLENAGSVSGAVVDAGGAAAPGALVTMSFREGSETRRFQVVTGADGTFQFAALPAGHTYELEVAEGGGGLGVYRAAGIAVGSDAMDLGVLRLDEHNPLVAAVSPEAGSEDVPPDTAVVLDFSELMRHESLDGEHIGLRQGSQPVPATLAVEDLPDPDGDGPRGPFTRVTLTHPELASDALYLVDVLRGVEDLGGRTLSLDFHSSFRTADTVAPFVVSVDPADDPQGVHPVGPDVEPAITFSEAVDPATVDDTTVRLLDSGGTEVPVQRTIQSEGFAVVLRPGTALALDGTYTLVAAGVADTSGNPMAAEFHSRFRVRDAQPPVVTLLPPPQASVDGDTWSVVEGTALTLRAQAVSNDPLASVRFFADGVELSGAPQLDQVSGEYRLGWTVPAGSTGVLLAVQAADVSGNLSEPAQHVLTVVDDAAPSGTLGVQPEQVILPNHVLHVSVDAQDDRGLASARIELTGAVSGVQELQFQGGATTGTVAADFRLPADAPAGAEVVVHATVTDSLGQSTSLAPVSVAVGADTEPPVLELAQPADGATVTAGDTVHFEAVLTDNVLAQDVSLTVAGEPVPLTVSGVTQPGDTWNATATADWTAPSVTETTQFEYTLTAVDTAGNTGVISGALTVEPLVNPEAPVVTIACPLNGDPCLPGMPVTLTFQITDDDEVDSYDVLVNGTAVLSNQAVNATSVDATFDWTPPVDAQPGDTFTIRIQARDFVPNEGWAELTLVVPEGTVLTGDQTLDSSHGGETLVLGRGTFTVDSGVPELNPDNLVLVQGAELTTTALHPLAIRTPGALRVACGAAIDVTGLGYRNDESYPGAGTPGENSGGSHLGQGGINHGPAGETFGSVYRPREAGGGGEGNSGYGHGYGGGVVTIDAGSLVCDGEILANGLSGDWWVRGGAGGSVWMRAGSVTGTGVVEVQGGTSGNIGAGGGGAVAIEYASGTGPQSLQIRAGGGAQSNPGGAGTVYVLGPDSTYGDLVVDNLGVSGELTVLPALASGTAQAGSAGSVLVTDRTAGIPAYFVGHWVRVTDPAGTVRGTWRVEEIDGAALVLEDGAAVEPGDGWKGLYRFDSVTVRGGARLVFGDPFEAGATSVEAGSELWPYNQAGPGVELSGVSVTAHDGAFWVAGSAGAVTDPDGVARATIRNTASGQTVTLALAADGSFPAIQVPGAAGDVLELEAVDAHALPRSSVTTIGALPANAGAPVVDAGAVQMAPSGPDEWTVTGAPGAVTDPELPVTVTLTNLTSGASTATVAAADGSFALTLTGAAGDQVQLTAVDGHPEPAQSTADLGPLPGNQPPSVDPAGLSVSYEGPGPEWGPHYEVHVAAGAITDADPPILVEISNPGTGESVGPVSLASGQAYTLSLEGMALGAGDVLELTATDSHPAEPQSATVELPPLPPDNYGPPEVNTSAVAIFPMGFGAMVVGSSGAVSDPDGPVMLVLRDTVTGWESQPFAAAEDGSFARRIPGDPGGSLTLEATDSHAELPLSTGQISLGTLPDDGIRADAVDTGGSAAAGVAGPLVLLDGGSSLGRASLRSSRDQAWLEVLEDVVDGIAPPVTAIVAQKPTPGSGPWYALSGGDLLVWLQDGGCEDGGPCWPAEVRPRSVSSGTLLAGRAWGGWLYLAADEASSGLVLHAVAEPTLVEDWDAGTRSLSWPCDGSEGVVQLAPAGRTALAVIPGPPGQVAAVTDDPGAELWLADVTDPLAPAALGSMDLPGSAAPAWAGWNDGELLLGRADGTVEVWRWNGDAMEAVAIWSAGTSVTGAELLGSQLWLGLADGRLQQLDLLAPGGPALLGELSLGSGAVHLADLGGSLLAAVDGQLDHIWAWELPPDLEPGQLAWQADGETSSLSVAVEGYPSGCESGDSRIEITWPDGASQDVSFSGGYWISETHATSMTAPPQVTVRLCNGISGAPAPPGGWFAWDAMEAPLGLQPLFGDMQPWTPAPCAAGLDGLGSSGWDHWTATADPGGSEVLLSREDPDTGAPLSAPLAAPGGVAALSAQGSSLWILDGGLDVWDLTDPAAPSQTTSLELLGTDAATCGAMGSVMDWNTEEMTTWLFAVGGSPPRLAAVNMNEPASPVVAADDVPLPSAQGTALAAAFADGSLLVLTGDAGTWKLLRYDVADPAAPVLLSTLELAGPAPVSMAAASFFAGESGTIVLVALVRADDTVELLDGTSGESLGSVQLPAPPRSAVVMGSEGRAYVPLGNGYGLAAVWADPWGGGIRVRFGFGPGGGRGSRRRTRPGD